MNKEILKDFCKVLRALDGFITSNNIKSNIWMTIECPVDGANEVYHRFDFEKYHWTNDNSLHVSHGIAWNDQYGIHEKFFYLGYNDSLDIESVRYWSQESANSTDYEKYVNINKYRLFEDTNLIDFPKFLNDLKMKIINSI